MFWDESEDEFAFVRTNATGSDSAITPDAYADLHVNAMDVDGGFDVAGASVVMEHYNLLVLQTQQLMFQLILLFP